jgi:hypothetical protein
MSDGDAFAAAARELGSERPVASLCRPFVEALPVRGAAISTLGDVFSAQTVCASDGLAARLDELQIDLGEGPCWDALAAKWPVQEPNFRAAHGPWPALAEALRDDDIISIFAFPLLVGSLAVGTVDLYAADSRTLTDEQVGHGRSLAALAAQQLLRRQLAAAGDPLGEHDREHDGGLSRRVVHQATGMVLAQLDVSPSDALLVIRAHAFASGRSVRDIAEAVVDRRLDFSS